MLSAVEASLPNHIAGKSPHRFSRLSAALPHNHPHPEKKMSRDFHPLIRSHGRSQNLPNLLRNISPPYRRDPVRPRHLAPHKRKPRIHQRQMQRMPNQVIDQHRTPADAQGLLHKAPQTLRIKMVREQVAADHVERIFCKRQSQPVANHSAATVKQVGPCPIQQSDIKRDPRVPDPLPDKPRNFSRTSGNLQQRETPASCTMSGALNQRRSRSHSAKPPINPDQVPQRSFNLARRTSVRVKNFRNVDPLHQNWPELPSWRRHPAGCPEGVPPSAPQRQRFTVLSPSLPE